MSDLDTIDRVRRDVSPKLDTDRRGDLGQFMTPAPIARFMVSLFKKEPTPSVCLLDPGAGVGALTAAFVEMAATGAFLNASILVTAFEIDDDLRRHLEDNLNHYRGKTITTLDIHGVDFVEEATNFIQFGTGPRFTHAILNPPYRKINLGSRYRALLSAVGIETVNLYSAFVALTLLLMRPGGEVVAIIPRSFCNGLYYRPFRDFLLSRAAISHLHLFDSRRSAFRDDHVLQENIVIHLVLGARQGDVRVSVTADATFNDVKTYDYRFSEIVGPNDPEKFIHIPSAPTQLAQTEIDFSTASLADLGLGVCTGPVVDFRLKQFLLAIPKPKNCVPLLYANHFTGGEMVWPKEGKKPNALLLNAETKKWLIPNGYYTITRRFSSKEERRRIVAYVVDPRRFPPGLLGFENHLNVFHKKKGGLSPEIAHGLAAYLNSTPIDDYFRRFSGHTQVNATDLRTLRYPTLGALERLGTLVMSAGKPDQQKLDELVKMALVQ